VLAVTVLTSLGTDALRQTGVDRDPAHQVDTLAALALDEGADGIVCSPREAEAVRGLAGPDRLVVTPGVRPAWAETGDQARVATPRGAIEAGASHLVIGRPVTAAEDPVAAFERILEDEQ
jgi:orotidine-5'-phosphate decarboxylase